LTASPPAERDVTGIPSTRWTSTSLNGERLLLRLGDFDQFEDRHNEWLANQDAGNCAGYVLVDEDGSVLGRLNLYRIKDGTAELGYRIPQRVAGRGVATAAVQELCELAASRYGLRSLRAATTDQNAPSQRVLIKAGFGPAGPADPADIGGKQGNWYRRELPSADAVLRPRSPHNDLRAATTTPPKIGVISASGSLVLGASRLSLAPRTSAQRAAPAM
jgi:ribosomal-protein-alanine N-acetyltransferase